MNDFEIDDNFLRFNSEEWSMCSIYAPAPVREWLADCLEKSAKDNSVVSVLKHENITYEFDTDPTDFHEGMNQVFLTISGFTILRSMTFEQLNALAYRLRDADGNYEPSCFSGGRLI